MRRAFLLLWLAWAILLAASYANLVADVLPAHARPIYFRVGSSVVLVVAAWLACAASRGSRHGRLLLCVAVGMSAGCLGDAWALVPDRAVAVPHLLPAMGLFGLGHLAYMAGFIAVRRNSEVRTAAPWPGLFMEQAVAHLVNNPGWYAAWAFWLAVAVVAWYFTAPACLTPWLRWPALVYSLLLAGTAATSTGAAMVQARLWPAAVGAALFLVSDVVLAIESFGGALPYGSDLCWATYGPGQMLIVFGTAQFAAGHRAARR